MRNKFVLCALPVLLLISSALMAADEGEGDKNAKTPVVDLGNQVWSQPLFGTGIKTNDVYTDGHIFFTVPIWSTIGRDGTLGGDYLFLEPYSSLGEQGEVATSLGLSWRHLFSDEPVAAMQKQGMARFWEEGWFVGGNVFLDMLDTQHNNQFWQMGVGAEAGTRYFEVRGNYYIPMTGEKLYDRQVHTQTFTSSSSSTIYNTATDYGTPFAINNNISQPVSSQTFATTSIATTTTTVRTVTELFEKGMKGWDAEASVLVPWLDQWVDLRITGGYLSFDNQPFGPANGPTGPVHGWKAGAELRPVPAVVLGGAWYEDKRFVGSDWIVTAELQIPMDKTWKDAFKMRRRHLVEHLAEPVHRQNDAIKVGNREDDQTTESSSTSVQHVTKIVSQTATQIVLKDDLIFVNNGGAVGNGIQAGGTTGDGTAQHPVNTIQTGANIAVTNNTSTGRVWNVYTQQSNVGPYVENVTINGSTNFISSGTLIPVMGGKFFGTGVKPILMGTFATNVGFIPNAKGPIGGATPLGYVGITGYQIIAATESPAIELHNVTSIKIDSNSITNPNGAGIQITNIGGNTSTAYIVGNLIDQTTLCSCFDAVEIGTFGHNSALNAYLTNNQITNTGGNGVSAVAIAGGQLYFNAAGNTISNAGIDGMNFQIQGKGALLVANITGNTVTGSGADRESESPEGSGISVNVGESGRARVTLASNILSNNQSNGLFFIADSSSQGKLTSSGNSFTGNAGSGAFIVLNDQSRAQASFTGDHFDNNHEAGLFVNADGNSGFAFTSSGGTFSGNGGAGVHIESHNGANVYPSTISGATIEGNSARALDLQTTDNGFIALTVDSSKISSLSGLAILARVGDGPSEPTPAVNLLLTLSNDTILSAGNNATGIAFQASGTGIGALFMERSLLNVVGVGSTGINLISSGTANAGPNIGVVIAESAILVANGPGIKIDASNASGVAVNVIDTTILSDGDGIVANTHDFATAQISVTGANTITSTGGNGINATASDGSLMTVNVDGATINAFNSGVYLTEGNTATLNATVTGSTINADVSNPVQLDSGILFNKNGAGVTADFNNNTISGGASGIYLANAGTGDMTANLNGNTILGSNYGVYVDNISATHFTLNINGNLTDGFTAGIYVIGDGGDFDTNINSNRVNLTGTFGINLEANSGIMHVNPSPIVLDSNTIDINRTIKLFVPSGTGTVDGTIIINGTTLTPPVTFP